MILKNYVLIIFESLINSILSKIVSLGSQWSWTITVNIRERCKVRWGEVRLWEMEEEEEEEEEPGLTRWWLMELSTDHWYRFSDADGAIDLLREVTCSFNQHCSRRNTNKTNMTLQAIHTDYDSSYTVYITRGIKVILNILNWNKITYCCSNWDVSLTRQLVALPHV